MDIVAILSGIVLTYTSVCGLVKHEFHRTPAKRATNPFPQEGLNLPCEHFFIGRGGHLPIAR